MSLVGRLRAIALQHVMVRYQEVMPEIRKRS